jgi:hypothetical protein
MNSFQPIRAVVRGALSGVRATFVARRPKRLRKARLSLGPFLWFGGAPGERIPALGEKIARHTKPNAKLEKADRPAHRVIPKGRFAKLETIDAVIEKLIGV